MSTATTDSTQNLNLNPGAEAKASQMALDQAAKKKKAGMIAVIALGALGLYLIFDWYFFVTTDNAQIQANIAILTARSTGFVSKVNVEEGQKVKAGQVLVEIDAKDYKSRTSQSENELGSVAARVRDAELNYNRIQNLYVAGAVSLQQRDSAYANFQELSKKQKALKAQVELSESGLSDTQLRAPSDGTIAKKGAELGMLASTGTPLIGFVSDDSRWVVANFKETDLSRFLRIMQRGTSPKWCNACLHGLNSTISPKMILNYSKPDYLRKSQLKFTNHRWSGFYGGLQKL